MEIAFPQQVVEVVGREKPEIVALSAMTIECLPLQEWTIKMLEATGLREKVKVMVGGR